MIGAYLPSSGLAPTAPSGAQTPGNATIADVAAQPRKIEGAVAANQPDAALADRIAAVEAATKSLNDSVATLSTRVDQVAAAAQTSTQNAVAKSDFDALTGRVAALESEVKSLSDKLAQQTISADDRTARLIAATGALRDAVERGAPFQAELAAVKLLGADATTTAALEPFATAGVSTAAALAHELAGLTPALLQEVERTSGDASFLGRLENNAQRLVRVTPVNAPAGDDPVSVAARINVDAAHADIAAALSDINKLPDTAKPIVAAWVQKAAARNAAIAAGRTLAASALAAVGKP